MTLHEQSQGSNTAPQIGGWTKKEFAELIGKSERSLDRWNEQRKGPPRIRVGTMILYPIKSYNEWLEAEAAKAAKGRV